MKFIYIHTYMIRTKVVLSTSLMRLKLFFLGLISAIISRFIHKTLLFQGTKRNNTDGMIKVGKCSVITDLLFLKRGFLSLLLGWRNYEVYSIELFVSSRSSNQSFMNSARIPILSRWKQIFPDFSIWITKFSHRLWEHFSAVSRVSWWIIFGRTHFWWALEMFM